LIDFLAKLASWFAIITIAVVSIGGIVVLIGAILTIPFR
jgi:hypothetical protein